MCCLWCDVWRCDWSCISLGVIRVIIVYLFWCLVYLFGLVGLFKYEFKGLFIFGNVLKLFWVCWCVCGWRDGWRDVVDASSSRWRVSCELIWWLLSLKCVWVFLWVLLFDVCFVFLLLKMLGIFGSVCMLRLLSAFMCCGFVGSSVVWCFRMTWFSVLCMVFFMVVSLCLGCFFFFEKVILGKFGYIVMCDFMVLVDVDESVRLFMSES